MDKTETQTLLGINYEVLEVRVAAAYKTGRDPHIEAASEIFDVAPEHVTVRQRRFGKRVNLGLMYGIDLLGRHNLSALLPKAILDRFYIPMASRTATDPQSYPGKQAAYDAEAAALVMVAECESKHDVVELVRTLLLKVDEHAYAKREEKSR
jgi:hypothetical protein